MRHRSLRALAATILSCLILGILLGLILRCSLGFAPAPERQTARRTIPLTALLAAMIEKESGGKIDAFNEKEEAFGILQIRWCMVQECNRIEQLRGRPSRWRLADALEPQEAVDMWLVYSDYGSEHSGRGDAFAIAARWNGGPRGLSKPPARQYAEDVCRIAQRYAADNQEEDAR